jgi:ABC-type transport system involved in multi-copper enzyme maturation permease subunit
MADSKGRPFLEILASALNEDYRFPILEIFAFLFALGTFALVSFASVSTSGHGEAAAYNLVSSSLVVSLFIFVILIFKNIAYGLGNDVERGVIQTLFSYPIKRHAILSAKLLSALGFSIVLLFSIQIPALYILAPGIVAPYISTVLLTYVANLAVYLQIAGVILLVALLLKKGGLALVVGIVLVFAMAIATSLVSSIASATNSILGLQILSVFSPTIALGMYYQSHPTPSPMPTILPVWTPSFTEALAYTGASYAVALFFFILGYLYFSRRMNL